MIKQREKNNSAAKRVICPKCEKFVHIDDFGGIDKEGVYHSQCIIDKMMEAKDESIY